jgi:hypothetical protein
MNESVKGVISLLAVTPAALLGGRAAGLCYAAALAAGIAAWLGAAEYAQRRIARRVKRGCCAECGYNLTGNVSGVCPECGVRIGWRRGERGSTIQPGN